MPGCLWHYTLLIAPCSITSSRLCVARSKGAYHAVPAAFLQECVLASRCSSCALLAVLGCASCALLGVLGCEACSGIMWCECPARLVVMAPPSRNCYRKPSLSVTHASCTIDKTSPRLNHARFSPRTIDRMRRGSTEALSSARYPGTFCASSRAPPLSTTT